MSTFDRDDYHWRETYFVFCDAATRPTLKQMEKLIRKIKDRIELTAQQSDDVGRFESITVLAPSDYAAIDILFVEGEEVAEQREALYEEMLPTADKHERAQLKKLRQCTGRFDLLHFEQLAVDRGEDEDAELLDPSALLLVVDAIVELTDGIGVDPQSGSLL
jgi:hypothetical protein